MRTLLFLLALLAPPAAHAAGGGKVAVLDVQTTGVDEKFVHILTEVLAAEVLALGLYDSVIAGRDIATMMGFERQRQLIGCDHTECLLEIGGALGVDRLVAGHVAKIGDTYVVNIKLINILTQRAEQRIYQTVKGEVDLLVSTIKGSVKKLIPASVDLAAPAATRAAEPAPSKDGRIGAGAIVCFAVGLAGLGAGVGFGLKAQGHHANATDPAFVGAQREIASGETSALIANLGYGIGAAGALTGLALWLFGGGSDAPALAPAASGDGAGLLLSGAF